MTEQESYNKGFDLGFQKGLETNKPSPIAHYKVFTSDEEFEKFQRENNVGISSIQPFAREIQFDNNINVSDAKVETAVFVVYFNKGENK